MKNDWYAIGTINVRLDSVKMFCTLAMQAGYLDTDEHARIYRVRPILVDQQLHRRLKDTLFSDDSDLYIRDLLLFCFLADHGLREGELAL